MSLWVWLTLMANKNGQTRMCAKEHVAFAYATLRM